SPPDQARVSVSVARHSEREDAESVRVLVGSRTASVAPEKLQRVFDPVQMVQESLIDVGPAVSQRLVEAVGGQLTVRQGRHELLRHVKRADPSIEVVMITAYASLETVRHALTHGAFEYLIKPFSRQDLEDVVHRALMRRQADLGARGQVARLVEEMRNLSAKTRELEEAARREAVEPSLRVTQLSILREISRTIVGELDPRELATGVSAQLQAALGYDRVTVTAKTPTRAEGADPRVALST